MAPLGHCCAGRACRPSRPGPSLATRRPDTSEVAAGVRVVHVRGASTPKRTGEVTGACTSRPGRSWRAALLAAPKAATVALSRCIQTVAFELPAGEMAAGTYRGADRAKRFPARARDLVHAPRGTLESRIGTAGVLIGFR
jgi:hypothetical protein